MRRVNEEACDDAVPELGLLPEDVDELAGRHREVNLLWIAKYINWTDIWHFHLNKGILFTHHVVKVMYVGVNGELINSLGIIQDEVR